MPQVRGSDESERTVLEVAEVDAAFVATPSRTRVEARARHELPRSLLKQARYAGYAPFRDAATHGRCKSERDRLRPLGVVSGPGLTARDRLDFLLRSFRGWCASGSVVRQWLGGSFDRKREGMIEPVFANTKFNRGIDRFQRRGRSAVRSEWELITATHTLLKLHAHQLAIAAP